MGLVREAIEFSNRYGGEVAKISLLIREYQSRNGLLAQEERNMLEELLSRAPNDTLDVFAESLLILLAKDTKKDPHEAVLGDLADYLWFHLKTAGFGELQNQGLSQLQSRVLSLGPDYFNSGSDILNYYKVLLMTG